MLSRDELITALRGASKLDMPVCIQVLDRKTGHPGW